MKLVRALLLLFIINNGSAEEPRCSKYDFEEKVLEKLLRMEFNENQRHADFERIKSVVDRRLAEMESLSTIVNNTINKVLADSFNIKEQIMEKFEATPEARQNVAFKARLNSNIDVTKGQTIVFPVVMFNSGNGYDSSTGVFTSSVNGTYMFNVVLCPYSKKSLNIAIVTGDEQNTVVTFFSYAGNACFSANAVVVLKSEQQVKIRVEPSTSRSTKIDQSIYRWNTFSGVLIHT